MYDNDPYTSTVDRMEPAIHPVDQGGAMASIAISLKRIADVMEALSNPDKLVKFIVKVQAAVDAQR